jgi:hypothetical protein
MNEVALIGAAGSGTSFALISRIKASFPETKIISFDSNPRHLVSSSLISDAFIQVPEVVNPAFPKTLEAILVGEGVTIFFPILNGEIQIAHTLAPKYSSIDFVNQGSTPLLVDKTFQSAWFSEIGIPTPALYTLSEAISKKERVFIKPKTGAGSQGAYELSGVDLSSLKNEDLRDSFLQEVCNGPEITVDSFHDYKKDVQFTFCRERVEVKSGVSTKSRIFFDKELDDIARRLARALKQNGTICFQAMKNKSGWVVTDLNLRSGAGTSMTVATGNDILAAGFAVRTGKNYLHLLERFAEQDEYFITRQYTDFVMKANA